MAEDENRHRDEPIEPQAGSGCPPAKLVGDLLIEWLADPELRPVVLDTVQSFTDQRRAPADTPPPVPRGRRVVEEFLQSQSWYRREFVPCGSRRCRKPKDEHGPYWYSYRFENGRWRPKYHGRDRPEAIAVVDLQHAERLIRASSTETVLTPEQVRELRVLRDQIASAPGGEAARIRQELGALVRKQRQLAQESARLEYSKLLREAFSSDSLSAEQERLLAEVGDYLRSVE